MNLKKIFLVIKFEFLTTMKRRSVLFIMFGLPLLSVLVLTGLNLITANNSDNPSGDPTTNLLQEITQGGQTEQAPDGLVDESGLLTHVDPDYNPYLIQYETVRTAESARAEGTIKGYFVIPASYLENGVVDYVAEDQPLFHPQEQMLVSILSQNLIGSPEIARRAINTANYQEFDISRTEEEQSNANDLYIRGLVLGFGLAILFYLTVIGSAGYLLQSLGKEKQNRVLEILLSSTRPVDLLIGKMIGLGAIGLVQLIIWSLIVNLLMGSQTSFFSNIEVPELAPATWFQAIAFFLVGYLVYGSLFAALGAISPGQKESSQLTFFLMLPTFLPLWFNSIVLTAPNQSPAVIMSLFPLTSPIAMPMRMTITAVPIWQIGLSLGFGFLMSFGMLALATRFFRSQNLLSGQSLNLRRVLQAFRS